MVQKLDGAGKWKIDAAFMQVERVVQNDCKYPDALDNSEIDMCGKSMQISDQYV